MDKRRATSPAPKVDIVFTGQVELENPNFSQANIVIEDGKLVTHNLQLQGTLKRNIKASVTGSFEASAADLGELFSKQPTGVVPTYGNSQTGNVLKTVPVGMVVTFFMTADMKVEATASLGYQWRDMDINAGMGFSYDDSLGLPVSLLTGQYQTPVPFWDATAHLDQTEGASYDVSGSASATLTAGVDGGIVLTGLEIAQATVEGGIRGSLAGQLSKPVGGSLSGCYSSASVTAGVRALLDVAAGVELKTDFKTKWLKWLNTSVDTGYVYEFLMYPGEGVDYLAETTIWSAGDDTCHNPQFSATAGTALYSYSFDATATAYQPMVASYSWNFGDGTTASGATTTHTYGSPGSYTATFTVLYSDGIQKTAIKSITVSDVPALNPAFTVSFNGLQASFDAGTSTPGADITGYAWSFGDGATATGITASHTYAAYSDTPWSVTLTVTDSYGRTASISQNVSAIAPTDTTPPTVSSTSPANSDTAVALNTAITASFSETMDASTVSTATFSLNNGVTGALSYTGTTATFTSSSNLAYSTTYTATITTGVKDAAGNAMATAYTWTFTTGTAAPAATGRMPDTNQTTWYNTSGTVISCAGTGQDGAYTINPPSYTDNGNGTVTDNVTGLIWQKQDDATTRT